MDRHNRSVDLAREYGRRLKDDLASFAEEKAAVVKDNGLLLDVQMSSTKEALNRLAQATTELQEKTETVAGRVDDVARIGDRISAYDSSMEELIRMAAKVEESMTRLREKAALVEQTAKKTREMEDRFGKLEKNLDGMESRFEQENTASLERTAETLISQVRSSVEDLQAAADTVERQVEQHREAVDRIETDRKALLERDVGIINKTLAEALERAGSRADKLEEAALVKLREEAMARVRRFQDTVEAKFKEYHENAKVGIVEIQTAVKDYQEGWRKDHEELERKQQEYRAAWQRDLEALDALALSQRSQWEASVTDTEERIARLGDTLEAKTAEAEEKLLRELDLRLEEYRENQKRQWERFESMAGDAIKLDEQLRLGMEDTAERIRGDFAVFEEEQARSRERLSAVFGESMEAFKGEMTALESELTELKNRAYSSVSEKLQLFEADFFADISRRSAEINSRLNEWQSAMEEKLAVLGEEAEAERRSLELSFKDGLSARIGEQSGQILSELERLRMDAAALEEKIRNGLDETEGRVSRRSTEIDDRFNEWQSAMEQTLAALGEEAEAERRSLELSFKDGLSARIGEQSGQIFSDLERLRMDAAALEEKIRNGLDETESRVSRRSTEIDARFNEWQSAMEQKLAALSEEAEAERRSLELSFRDELNAQVGEQSGRILSVLERLRVDAAALEEKMQNGLNETEGRFSRRSTEIDGRFNEWQSAMEQKLAVLNEEAEAERRSLELSFKDELNAQVGEQSERILSVLEQLRIDAETLEEKIRNGLGETESQVSRRSAEIDGRFNEWQSAMEQKLAALNEEAEAERRSLELSFKDELNAQIGGQSERILSDFERLRMDAAALEEKIRNGLDDAESRVSRRSAEIDGRFNEWQAALEQKLAALNEEAEAERRSLELSFKDELNARVGEQSERILSDLERLQVNAAAFEEKIQTGLGETESRVSRLSANLEEIRRELKDFSSQTRLFEKTDELKASLERSMEALKSDMAGIEERRAEAAQLETEFIKIRRLEDEVNSKMTRFLSEKNHLDIMEKDFERLIQTSQRVEERLKEVTGADDTLQGIQVTLRKLEDAIVAADEKYQRIEKKNHILEETNSSIERNFLIMEETEAALQKCRENIDKAGAEIDSFRPAIEELAEANEKARNTTEKLDILDTSLKTIEERIGKMQTAREWLARAETRFEELHKNVQEELKLIEAVLRDESKKSRSSKGAPAIAVRENVVRLRRQGWGAEEIARNLNISRGEVELILELGLKD
jgi:chromosome segregation ATPase